MEWLFAIIVIAVAFVVYLLPAIVAAQRDHNNYAAILTLNLLAGWTTVGWVIALVWAFTDNVSPGKYG